jgi:excisionase family DNA binding protein
MEKDRLEGIPGNNQKIQELEYANHEIKLFDRHQSYTYAQAARFLGVSVRTVMREVKAARLIAHKIRGCTRIHGADVLAYQQEGKCR